MIARSPLHLAIACATVLASLATTVVAHAQTTPEERRAAARALFQEGVSFTTQNRWADAEDRFRRALALERLAVVVYNLGVALERQGRLVEGSELLREAARDPGRAGESARQALATVEPRIPRLDLDIQGLRADDVVFVDGARRDRALVGVAVPIDPGNHRVEVRRGERVVASRDIVLAERAQQTVSIEVPPPEVTEVDRGAGVSRRRDGVLPRVGGPPLGPRLPPDDEDEDDDGGSVLTTWWFWTAVGVVAAGAATTAIVISQSGGADPYRGNFMPGSLEVD